MRISFRHRAGKIGNAEKMRRENSEARFLLTEPKSGLTSNPSVGYRLLAGPIGEARINPIRHQDGLGIHEVLTRR
jgi:hypothetical protein